MFGSVNTAVGRISPRRDLWQVLALLLGRAADRESVRRRFPSACRASRRRYSRATAPRRRRTSRPCRDRGRRIPRGWSGRTRRSRRGRRSPPAEYRRWRDASPARAGRPRLRRSGASGSRIASKVSSRPGSPIAPVVRLGDQRREPRARLAGVLPVAINVSTASVRYGATSSARQAEIGEADDLALAHRNAAENLREIFADADLRQQGFGFAEAALSRMRARIGGHFLDRLDIGREPGEAVGGVLLALRSSRRSACRPR